VQICRGNAINDRLERERCNERRRTKKRMGTKLATRLKRSGRKEGRVVDNERRKVVQQRTDLLSV
jgi:hypothetical protein